MNVRELDLRTEVSDLARFLANAGGPDFTSRLPLLERLLAASHRNAVLVAADGAITAFARSMIDPMRGIGELAWLPPAKPNLGTKDLIGHAMGEAPASLSWTLHDIGYLALLAGGLA